MKSIHLRIIIAAAFVGALALILPATLATSCCGVEAETYKHTATGTKP